ncbi:hypothetical protein [Candidatus Liberibacter sp.]|uniref:hypothetical protein n=1 Tax=Candidatus Liberibacter sp. TaxID=34022 RepID=UPI0015F53B04|nr:hypothetical protein [Candidatus Liberibacter sp.]MBA5724402.1 hypothetical protein [Candidatus Liberibacter sp.]
MFIYDGSWRLVNYDPITGRTIWCCSDDQQEVYRIDYPIDHLIEHNKLCRQEISRKKNGDWQRVASIPVSVLRDSHLMQAHSKGDDIWIKNWLNNKDNGVWRTSEGYV